MPNGREHLEYEDFGSHKYADHEGTSDCAHGCGCWAGPFSSGGPAGVDPLGGKCPGNIKRAPTSSGRVLGEKEILDDFINGRIDFLSRKVAELRPYKTLVLESRKNTKIKLQEEVVELKRELVKLKYKMGNMKEIANKANREISSL